MIVAIANGHVGYISPSEDQDIERGSRILIIHPDSGPTGWILVMYVHLGEIFVNKGDDVRRGQPLGTAWQPSQRKRNYGFEWTPHVHLKLITENSKGTRDPLDIVSGCLSESQITSRDLVYPVSC
jgi:murein DD-endopeptidase MepM/ murein hydrolase activator NlpD